MRVMKTHGSSLVQPLKVSSILIFTLLISSCAAMNSAVQPLSTPETTGESLALYKYIPLDPLTVLSRSSDTCSKDAQPEDWLEIKKSLPDNAVRMAIREINAKGDLVISGSQVGAEGKDYQVVVDYMNSDVGNVEIALFRKTSDGTAVPVFKDTSAYTYYTAKRTFGNTVDSGGAELFTIPVYIGIGLRLTANVRVLRGNINISSLGALSAAAEAGHISGSLVVQTLGITGEQIANLLPLPSELNATTVQNAILAMGAIKAVIHDEENTTIYPRVVGISRNYGLDDERIINAIVSELANARVTWFRRCS